MTYQYNAPFKILIKLIMSYKLMQFLSVRTWPFLENKIKLRNFELPSLAYLYSKSWF